MFNVVTKRVRPLEDDYIYTVKLIHHPGLRCRCSHVVVLQDIPNTVGAQPVVDRAKKLVENGAKIQEADCIIGIMDVNDIRYRHKNAVNMFTSTERWCTVHIHATMNLDGDKRASGMHRHMFVWMLLAVRKGGLVYVVCSFCGKF